MIALSYEIKILSTKERVFQTIIGKDTYNDWVKAFSPGSRCEGEWKKGSEMKFFDPDFGGTFAVLSEFTPNELIVAEHVATVNKEGVRETTGESTEKWIGSKEIYEISETADGVRLAIRMETDESFREMFDRSWPKALENIKRLAEAPR